MLEITSSAVVSGGIAKVGNGLVVFAGSSGENVTFLSTGIGGLEIADRPNNTSAYSGQVSGFGAVNHSNHTQFIDLISVASAAGQITDSFSGGVLTVSSGSTVVATIAMVGTYSAGNFHIGSGISGTVKITDPGVVNGASVESGATAAFGPHGRVDFSEIAFAARTTLAYSADNHTGGTLIVADAREAAGIALLGNHMAASFVTAAVGHHHATMTAGSETAQQPPLTHPPHA